MTKTEIIQKIWDTDKTGWDLQIDINLNSSVSRIEEAMEEYAKEVAWHAFQAGVNSWYIDMYGDSVTILNFDEWWIRFTKQNK